MQDLFEPTDWVGIYEPKRVTSKFPNLTIGFTTRNGGVSTEPFHSLNVGLHVQDHQECIIQNRTYIAEQIGFPLSAWVTIEQVHGSHIQKLCIKDLYQENQTSHVPLYSACDGIYTNHRGVLLVTFYADCVPLYFYAPKHHLIGLAHSGGKGTAAHIGRKMLDTWMQEEGVLPKEVYVIIGPAIGSCCYTVDSKVQSAIANTLPPKWVEKIYRPIFDGKYAIDLKLTCYYQILECNIPENQIYQTNHCTSCLNEVYFSYRRDQGKTGRMMSFIGL